MLKTIFVNNENMTLNSTGSKLTNRNNINHIYVNHNVNKSETNEQVGTDLNTKRQSQ
jgi:hypothetical protein